jgi:hypothetical protein
LIAWPEELVSDIARRRAIIYIGAGVSVNSVGNHGVRPPTWSGLLDKALSQISNPKQHIQSLLKQNDFLTACEVLKGRSECSPPPARMSGGGLEHDRLASEDPADGGERAQAV